MYRASDLTNCMTDISPNPSTIKVQGDFGGFTPAELFDYWVDSSLLVRWWPAEATVEPRVGGSYALSWPQQGWHLRGSYTAFEAGRHLGFTWAWDHDAPGTNPTQVDLTFEETDEGTRLTIDHGPWPNTEEAQTERSAVIEGWIHFGMRLAGLRTGAAT